MEIPEFTCLCPMTGQPDFATLVLDYVADRLCVELKSLKLYIWSFRDEGAFHEAVTNRILDDLVRATQPRYMRLEARFNVRGGIFTTVVAEHRKRGWAGKRLNPALERLQPYPFEKLRALLAGVTPNPALRPISLSIGEPKHPTPAFIKDALAGSLDGLAALSADRGHCRRCARRSPAGSRGATASRRPTPRRRCCRSTARARRCSPSRRRSSTRRQTRWSSARIRSTRSTKARRCSPARRPVPNARRHAFDWTVGLGRRRSSLYVCSPGNPTRHGHGPARTGSALFELSDRHGFVIASDECYSEIYFDERSRRSARCEAAHKLGRTDYPRLVVFSSLSKRSNCPGHALGLRRRRRGAAQEIPALPHLPRLRDEPRRAAARRSPPGATRRTCARTGGSTREKFDAVLPLVATPLAGRDARRRLLPLAAHADRRRRVRAPPVRANTMCSVLPGSYLAREAHGVIPGTNHVRIALVAPLEECVEARSADAIHAQFARERAMRRLQNDHRRRLGKPRQPQPRQRAARAARGASTRRIAGLDARQAARRREDRRRVDHAPVDQEGGAAVVPPRGQPRHGGRRHALLRQGADSKFASYDAATSPPAASASCRPPSRAAAPSSRRTWC